jgi:hypothetical protein
VCWRAMAWPGWASAAAAMRSFRIRRRLSRAERLEGTVVGGNLVATTGFLVAGLSEYNFGGSEVVMGGWWVMAVAFAAASQDRRRNDSAERIPT